MNKRIKNKLEKAKRQEIHTLINTVLDINGLFPRKRSISGELPTVFVDFSGHTGKVYLSVHSSGWYPDSSPDWRDSADISSLRAVENMVERLKARYL